MRPEYEYDVALSFAGERRNYVEQVANGLRAKGIRVFYDKYEEASLWGKDLYEHLDYVYQRAARFCVVFASVEYAEKMWTTHERRSAQARAIEERAEYVLPARFDDTEIPGIRKTIGHIDLRTTSPEELASLVAAKLGPSQRSRFLPPVMDRLFDKLGVTGDESQFAEQTAAKFYSALTRMSEEERVLLGDVFLHSCPMDLPENVHIDLDLIRRVTGLPVAEVKQILGGLRSLGVDVAVYSGSDHPDDTIAVRWFDAGIYDDDSGQADFSLARSTEVAHAVVQLATDGMCEDHSREIIRRLDLGSLSLATLRSHDDEHDIVKIDPGSPD